MLCEMLSLMWSCNCCVTCFSVGAVVSEWKIEQIVMGGGSNGSGRLCNLLSIVSLHAWNPFWRVMLHRVCIELMETIRVYMMCGVWYAQRSWALFG